MIRNTNIIMVNYMKNEPENMFSWKRMLKEAVKSIKLESILYNESYIYYYIKDIKKIVSLKLQGMYNNLYIWGSLNIY